MAFLLKPDMFPKMTSLQDITTLAAKDVKNAAGKDVSFVAVKKFKLAGKETTLFLVTDNAAAWEKVLKQQKVDGVATGECRILKEAKPCVAVRSVKGGTVSDVVNLLRANLKELSAVDLEAHERNEKTRRIVQDSHDKAGTGVKITPDTYRSFVHTSLELREYGKFAASFEELAKKYKFTDYKKVPVTIWAELIKSLVTSNYVSDNAPKDGKFNLLEVTDATGKKVREATLAAGMEGMKGFTAHAAKYLDKVVAEVRKAGGTPTWSFWSGIGAKNAARNENATGVVLEGSVGSWFDNVWDFAPFTDLKTPGISNMALWTSMSELYAQKAAEYYDSFSFRGYVGPTATRDQSVFNKIEQPTFIQVLTVKKQVSAPKVDWFVVDCEKNAAGDWTPTGNPSLPFPSRAAATAEITRRYGA